MCLSVDLKVPFPDSIRSLEMLATELDARSPLGELSIIFPK